MSCGTATVRAYASSPYFTLSALKPTKSLNISTTGRVVTASAMVHRRWPSAAPRPPMPDAPAFSFGWVGAREPHRRSQFPTWRLGRPSPRLNVLKAEAGQDAVALSRPELHPPHPLLLAPSVAGRSRQQRAADCRAITASQMPDVSKEWRQPERAAFRPRNPWRRFNAFTSVYRRTNPHTALRRGEAFHGLFDAVIGMS